MSGWKLKRYSAEAEIASIQSKWDKEKTEQAAQAILQAQAIRAKEREDARHTETVEKGYQLATAENRALSSKLRMLVNQSGGLRDPGSRPGCVSGVATPPGNPANPSAPSDIPAAGSGFLSTEASNFIIDLAAQCDEVATYANAAHEWAKGL